MRSEFSFDACILFAVKPKATFKIFDDCFESWSSLKFIDTLKLRF